MIAELELTNFKAFGNTQRVPLRPITLIFGANSSGKSSLLHALLLAHHGVLTGEFNVNSPLLAGDTVDLGGIRQFTFMRNLDLACQVGLSFTTSSFGRKLQHIFSDEEPEPVSIKVAFEIDSNIQGLGKYQFWLDNRPLLTLGRYFRGDYNVEYINTDHPFFEDRLARVQKKLFDGGIPLWRLKEALNELKKVYKFENRAIADKFDPDFSWISDEGGRDENDVKYTSLLTAASFEDPDVKELFEKLGDEFRKGPHDFIWYRGNHKNFPEGIRNAKRLEAVFALATELENSIIREVRLNDTLRSLHRAVVDKLDVIDYLGPLRALPKRIPTTASKDASWRSGRSGSDRVN